MKKILTLLMVMTVFFSLSTVASANATYVVGMDTTQYNDLVPEGFILKKSKPSQYPHANCYRYISQDSSKFLEVDIGIYPSKEMLINSVEQYLKDACSVEYKRICSDVVKVGTDSWVMTGLEEQLFARNNVFIRVYLKGPGDLEISKYIDDLIVNQKPPFKYAKTPPSAPIPKIPKKIKNNEDTWKALFKDYSGWYEVVTNGQAIYRKKRTKETFEPAKKTGKVKLTINIVTDDNLFDTKEVETELVP